MLAIARNRLLLSASRTPETTRYWRQAVRILTIPSNMTSSSDRSTDDCQDAPGLLKIFKSNQKRLSRINFLSALYKAAGHELRIAGGAVRDILTGVEPKDIDFATTAVPETSLDILRKYEDIVRIIVTAAGQKHGTVAVKFKEQKVDLKRIKLDTDVRSKGDESVVDKPEYDDESPFEITTLRCDEVTDGRHAEVKFVNDWKIDAERRDLTINAMFLTLDEGKLVDYFEGEKDLNEGRVRFVGDAELRIQEDYLRILRFFRFWNRYSKGTPPDDATTIVIGNNLNGLDKISGERIWQELKKMFSHVPCSQMVNLILKVKLPRFVGLEDNEDIDYESYSNFVRKEIEIAQKNISEFMNRIDGASNHEVYSDKKIIDLKSTILFSSLVKTPSMCLSGWKRLKFSNLERDVILHITECRETDLNLKQMMRQLAISNGPERGILRTKLLALMIYKGEFTKLEELSSWIIPTFPMGGTIIAQEMKSRQLPRQNIKIVLEHLKNLWADSDYLKSSEDLENDMKIKLDEMKNNQ